MHIKGATNVFFFEYFVFLVKSKRNRGTVYLQTWLSTCLCTCNSLHHNKWFPCWSVALLFLFTYKILISQNLLTWLLFSSPSVFISNNSCHFNYSMKYLPKWSVTIVFDVPHLETTAFLVMLALLLPPPPPPPPPCQRWLGMVKASTLMPMVLEGMALNCFLSELYL